MNFPYKPPFSMAGLGFWIEETRPTQIEMTDSQYAWFTTLRGSCEKKVGGIPIIFIDELKSRV